VEPLSVKHEYKGKLSNDLSQIQLLTVPISPDLPQHPTPWHPPSPRPSTSPPQVEPLSVKHEYKGKLGNDLSQIKLLTVPISPDLPPPPTP
jgi:hypothetical protein